MSQRQTSRREALRAQQEAQAAAAKRRKIVGIVAGIVAVVLVVVVVVAALNRSNGEGGDGQGQVVPPSADARTGIFTINGDKAKKGVPTVTVYQDYQCPICKQVHQVYGPALESLASKGEIKLQYRTLTFLDSNLRNDASERAAMAAAAADVVGRYSEYHDVVFDNQPEEGKGYSDEQLRDTFARDAGITGEDLTKFQKLYDDKATADFVRKAADQGLKEGTELDEKFGTPAFTVNGKMWTEWRTLQDPREANLLKEIKKAGAQK